ncbi:MAG: DUF3800 domain-containing protein, partial [Candidatus Azambacteria bacterium]|nr:DUF3800 domain-containing protein [Candidatus Azambacteria bacterium]
MGEYSNYIFVDESGDPGKPYDINAAGDKTPTGASMFYILTALPLTSQEVFLLEDRMLEIKNKFGYKKEIKSIDISLALYKELLNIINELNIKTFYRLVNKETYKGKFAIDGNKKLHNVFDEYNLVKLVSFSIKERGFLNTEVIIDRADRRLLDGKFDNCNEYLMKKINTKTIKRVSYVTHVNSEYVNCMQMTDLICGAVKDYFT